MNKNYSELYINSVYNLAETLVVKSEATAEAINKLIVQMYGDDAVDEFDKTTHKYYMNICGLYHPTDSVITVTSLDTLQTISFTSDNLTINTATKKAYQYGTRSYEELISLYPQMEMLILGVLYPADMNKSINALDGTILSYPPVLVENNELSLISNINEWINRYQIRWYNRQFGLSDTLYYTTYLGIMYLNLVPAIINLRLAACKTSEAHSFHVRQYLVSHGLLDVFLDQMSTKQTLFFYRNISYIERNSGKRFIFQWLLEHIMTERNMPMAEITMKHDVSSMPVSILPVLDFKRISINTSFNASNIEQYTLDQLLGKEAPLTTGNINYIAENSDNIKTEFENSLSSVVATKVLESSVIDYTDATPYTFHDIAINHWLAFSANGYYNTYSTFKNPRTGSRYSIQCKDAFIYFLYTTAKALGGDPTVIPLIPAQRVFRLSGVTVPDLMSVVDNKYVSVSDAIRVISLRPIIERTVAVDAFFSKCTDIFNCNQDQLKFVANQEHQYKRGLIANMVARTYSDPVIQLEPDGTLFSDWLVANNLPTTDFTMLEYLDINKQLFEQFTGSSIDSSSATRSLQNAMIGLMKKLSSYSVQFLSEVNGSNIKLLNWAAIRIGDIKGHSSADVKIVDLSVNVLSSKAKSSVKENYEINSPGINVINHSRAKQTIKFLINVRPRLIHGSFSQKFDLRVSNFRMGVSYADASKNNLSSKHPIGYEDFFALGITDNTIIKDVYCDCYDASTVTGTSLSSIILINRLNMLKYPGIINGDLQGFTFDNFNLSTLALQPVSGSGVADGLIPI